MEVKDSADAVEVRAALERILESEQFRGSALLQRFLRYTVEKTLEGDGAGIKELTLGTEVCARGPGYDPRTDPIVRVTANRLRAKLLEYYETRGAGDAVRIEYRKGSYAPVFRQVNQERPVAVEAGPAPVPEPVRTERGKQPRWWLLAAAACVLAAGLGAGWTRLGAGDTAAPEARSKERAEKAYRMGMYLKTKERRELYPEAEKLFLEAAELDPGLVAAQVEYERVRLFTAADQKWAAERAFETMERVLEKDPKLAAAYEFRAFLRRYFRYDWKGALKDGRRAVALNPGSDLAHASLAGTLQTMGRLDDALVEMQRAWELNPAVENHRRNLADHYYRMHRFQDAAREFKAVLDLNPQFPDARRQYGRMLLTMGQAEAALAEFERAPVKPDPQKAVALFKLGRVEQARKLLAECEEPPDAMVRALAGMGEVERALDWLEKAAAMRHPGVPGLYTHPEVDSLRGDPRFAAVFRKIGLIE